MAAAQKRMLNASKGKISKMDPNDLITALRAPGAWDVLSDDKKRRLYSMLPIAGKDGKPLTSDEVDLTVNPLDSEVGASIEKGIKRFHGDLSEGRREKKWVVKATKASHERRDGKFDEFLLAEKEEYWGKDGEPLDEDGKVGVDDPVRANGDAS